MKTKSLLLWLMLLVGALSAQAQQIEAYFAVTQIDPWKSMVKFYYDNKRSQRQNTFTVTENGTPLFNGVFEKQQEDIDIYFDSSFADYKPSNTSHWFIYTFAEGCTVCFSGWENLNTSQVTNMSHMFDGLIVRDDAEFQFDLTHFDTSKVTDMSYMLANMKEWSGMGLSLDLSSFTFKSNANTAGLMKNSIVSELHLPASANNLASDAFYGVGSADNPAELFCYGGFSPTGGVQYTGYYKWKGGCFTVHDPEAYAVLSSDNKTLTFYYDSQKSSRTGDKYDLNTGTQQPRWYSKRSSVTSVEFDPSFAYARPTSCYQWFYEMSNLTTITGIENLKTDAVTNMKTMFFSCSKLQNLDVSHFDTSKVTDMTSMFYSCKQLRNLDVSHFDTRNVTKMNSMFFLCYSQKSLDVSHFDTSNVVNMGFMFDGCSALTSLDLSNFNTSNASVMDNMFSGCYNLTSLDLSSFTFSSDCASTKMMSECSRLRSLTLPSTAGYLSSDACSGVGKLSAPCALIYPDDLTITPDETGSGWYKWKGGYFKDGPKAYYVVVTEEDDIPMMAEVTFYYDNMMASREGTPYLVPTNGGELIIDPKNRCYGKVITFDSSFADYRPTNTARWFKDLNYQSRPAMGEGRILFSGLENLNTSEVTDMSYMFYRMDLAEGLDLTHFDTSKVTDMSYMLAGLNEGLLSDLDLSGFTFNSGTVTTGLMEQTQVNKIILPATANNLASGAFSGVGNMNNDCPPVILVCPDGFSPSGTVQQNGYFTWKGGNFKLSSNTAKEAYFMLMPCDFPSKQLFLEVKLYYDNKRSTRQGVPFLVPTDGGKLNIDGYNLFHDKYITFDSSFADYRPTSTREWFRAVNYRMEEEEVSDGNVNFYGMENLNTSEVTDMSFMFYDMDWADGLDLSHFDTRKVTDMSYMLATIDEQWLPIDLSAFTFNPTTITDGFLMATHANQLTIPSTANNLASDAFAGVGSKMDLVTLVNPSGIRLEGAVQYEGYFTWKGGYFLGKIPAPEAYAVMSDDNTKMTFYYDMNKSSRTGTVYLFDEETWGAEWHGNSSSVTSVEFNPSFADARPTNCYSWFDNMSSLTDITGIEYLNTEDVADMSYMFLNCSSLESIDVSRFNTEKVNNMVMMFAGCIKMSSLDLSNFTFKDGMNTGYFLAYCGAKTLTVPSTAGYLADTAFEGVGKTNAPCTLIYPDDLTITPDETGSGWYKWKGGYFKDAPKAYAVLDGTTLTFYYDSQKSSRTGEVYDMNKGSRAPGWFVINNPVTTVEFDPSFADARPTSCYQWFNEMRNLTTIKGIENLKTDEVTNMWRMFYACSQLKSLDLSGFNTSKVTIMSGMFSQCTQLTSLNLTRFETSNVTSMQGMFTHCDNLERVDLSNFNTANVKDMSAMFSYCIKMKEIDVSNFDTSKTVEMMGMFNECNSLNYLDISNFVIPAPSNSFALNADYLFQNCTSLKTLVIPATGYNIGSNSCNGVGTQSAPCTLIYPSDLTITPDETGSGWYKWRGGYFRNGRKGDVNVDGAVTIADVMMTVSHIVGTTQSGFVKSNADVNGDKDINISDVMTIVQMVIN